MYIERVLHRNRLCIIYDHLSKFRLIANKLLSKSFLYKMKDSGNIIDHYVLSKKYTYIFMITYKEMEEQYIIVKIN